MFGTCLLQGLLNTVTAYVDRDKTVPTAELGGWIALICCRALVVDSYKSKVVVQQLKMWMMSRYL